MRSQIPKYKVKKTTHSKYYRTYIINLHSDLNSFNSASVIF